MRKEWVVIASSREGRILEKSWFSDLRQIQRVENPLGREHNRAMTLDKPGLGRGKSASGVSPFGFARKNSPHELALQSFAKKLADLLSRAWSLQAFHALTVVAEPHLMGRLKSALRKSPLLAQIRWVKKDLQNVPIEDLPRHLRRPTSSF